MKKVFYLSAESLCCPHCHSPLSHVFNPGEDPTVDIKYACTEEPNCPLHDIAWSPPGVTLVRAPDNFEARPRHGLPPTEDHLRTERVLNVDEETVIDADKA